MVAAVAGGEYVAVSVEADGTLVCHHDYFAVGQNVENAAAAAEGFVGRGQVGPAVALVGAAAEGGGSGHAVEVTVRGHFEPAGHPVVDLAGHLPVVAAVGGAENLALFSVGVAYVGVVKDDFPELGVGFPEDGFHLGVVGFALQYGKAASGGDELPFRPAEVPVGAEAGGGVPPPGYAVIRAAEAHAVEGDDVEAVLRVSVQVFVGSILVGVLGLLRPGGASVLAFVDGLRFGFHVVMVFVAGGEEYDTFAEVEGLRPVRSGVFGTEESAVADHGDRRRAGEMKAVRNSVRGGGRRPGQAVVFRAVELHPPGGVAEDDAGLGKIQFLHNSVDGQGPAVGAVGTAVSTPVGAYIDR